MKKNKPAIFLDRDGTILNERGYLSDPKKMFFYRGVFPALAALKKRGYRLVVITNQSGVGRGYFSLATLARINREFKRRLAARGVTIDGIYFCPHLPDAGCACRKPKTLMVKRASRDLGIDLKQSMVVGDQARDVQLAKNAAMKGILVLTGAGRSARRKVRGEAAHVAATLTSASRWILSHGPIK